MKAGEDTAFGRLETSVVVNATTGSGGLGGVDIEDDCAGLKTERLVEGNNRVVPLLELVCTADVVTAVEDVVT